MFKLLVPVGDPHQRPGERVPADPLRRLVEEEPLPRGGAAQEGLDRGLGRPVALGVEAEQGVAEGEAAELKRGENVLCSNCPYSCNSWHHND